MRPSYDLIGGVMRYTIYLIVMGCLLFLYGNCAPVFQTSQLPTYINEQASLSSPLSPVQGSSASAKLCADPAIKMKPIYVGLKRLSRTEINNSINDLFGVDYKLGDKLPLDASVLGFDNNASALTVSFSFLNIVIDESEALLNQAFLNASSRSLILICQTADAACATQVINKFIKKAYHRKITTADTQALLSVYQIRRTAGDTHEAALKVVLRTAISSVEYLYFSVGANGATSSSNRNLSAHELASRLSFFLWGTIPDDELLNLADLGTLQNPEILKAQTLRMLKSSKALYLVNGFASKWLDLDLLNGRTTNLPIFPQFTSQIRTDMIDETKYFLQEVILNDKSPLDLVNANYTFLNDRLASFYGITRAPNTNFTKTDISMTERRGLLGQGSFLTVTSGLSETSVVKRGHMILDKFICASPPPVPDNLQIPESFASLVTAREHSNARLANSSCVGCHRMMDPYGFILEGFGPYGTVRNQMPDGSAVDNLTILPDGRRYTSPKELTQDLAKDENYKYCISKNLMTYALGKMLVSRDETCKAVNVGIQSVSSTSKFSELIFSIVNDVSFKMEGSK